VEGTLIVAGAGAGGPAVHLSAAEPLPAPRPALLGRSCHDAGEVARAGAEGCDWVTVSPVHPTVSKPGYGPALGSAGLAALCRVPGAPPVYALGGVSRSNARACRSAGAYGVAVMGGVMRAERPDRCVELLLGELSLSGPAEKSAP
jgi:thiamine-phosphate pyrophosphorylase